MSPWEGVIAPLNKVELFYFHAPVKRVSTLFSKICSWVALGCILAVACIGIIRLSQGEVSVSRNNEDYDPNVKFSLPNFGFGVKVGYNFLDLNDAATSKYVSVEMKLSTINNADARDKEKVKINPSKCTIRPTKADGSTSKTVIDALCVPQDTQHVQGFFDDGLYTYVEISIIPCADGPPNCHSKADVKNYFDSQVIAGNFWIEHPRNSRTGKPKWSSIVYQNIRRGDWLGVEVFLRPIEEKFYNIFGLKTEEYSGIKLQRTDLRVSPRSEDQNGFFESEEELMKLYIRVGDQQTFVIHRPWSLIDFGQSVGGMWSLIAIVFGSISIFYNRKYHESSGKKRGFNPYPSLANLPIPFLRKKQPNADDSTWEEPSEARCSNHISAAVNPDTQQLPGQIKGADSLVSIQTPQLPLPPVKNANSFKS